MKVRRMTLIPLAPNQVNYKFRSNSFKNVGNFFLPFCFLFGLPPIRPDIYCDGRMQNFSWFLQVFRKNT